MRRLLLLAALCAAAVLAFVPAELAVAQSASADPCPDPDFPRETPDGCQASDLPDVGTGSASASASATPDDGGAITARGADTAPLNADGTCPEGYVTVNAPFCAEESPNTPGRIFGYGEGDLASATASASSSATASASAEALPETGGPSILAFALPSLALLVAGGIFAARVVRR